MRHILLFLIFISLDIYFWSIRGIFSEASLAASLWFSFAQIKGFLSYCPDYLATGLGENKETTGEMGIAKGMPHH